MMIKKSNKYIEKTKNFDLKIGSTCLKIDMILNILGADNKFYISM